MFQITMFSWQWFKFVVSNAPLWLRQTVIQNMSDRSPVEINEKAPNRFEANGPVKQVRPLPFAEGRLNIQSKFPTKI